MADMQFLGYLLTGLGVIIAFITSVAKIGDRVAKPINELRLVIQKLSDAIDNMKEINTTQNKRLDRHSEHLDKLDNRINKLEVKMDMYHGKDAKNS